MRECDERFLLVTRDDGEIELLSWRDDDWEFLAEPTSDVCREQLEQLGVPDRFRRVFQPCEAPTSTTTSQTSPTTTTGATTSTPQTSTETPVPPAGESQAGDDDGGVGDGGGGGDDDEGGGGADGGTAAGYGGDTTDDPDEGAPGAGEDADTVAAAR